ncbi:hypothetical protein ACV1D9_21275 [Aeromonas allosaccharophila]
MKEKHSSVRIVVPKESKEKLIELLAEATHGKEKDLKIAREHTKN